MKKLLSLLLVFVMAFSLLTLTSCNKKTAPDSGDASAPASDAGSDDGSSAPTSDAGSDDGTVYNFVVQNHDPASSICGQYVEAWGSAVTEASNGRITFDYYHGGSLVGAGDSVNAVLDGTADMCWSAATIYSGQFPISEFIQLPLSGINCARMGSDVMMDMYNEMPEFQDEYKDFKVIMLGSCTYAPVSTTEKKLETLDDIQGLRIRAPGSTCGLWCTAVGMSPMTVATPETYEQLEKGVIEGCLNDWHNISAFNLGEVLDYIMDFPTPGSPIFLLMNKDKYNALPDDLKAIIDEYSGAYASDMAGIYWDSTRAWIYDNADEIGVEIYEPSDELYAAFTDAAVRDEVHTQYIEYLNQMGLDGQAIYDKCMEIVSSYSDEYADPWAEPVLIENFNG